MANEDKPEFERLESREHLDVVVIETSPPVFVAPGIDYTMYVKASNVGLTTDTKTYGVNWKVGNTYYEGTYNPIPGVSTGLYGDGIPLPKDDFFSGVAMYNNLVDIPGKGSGREVQNNPLDSPSNRQGVLGEYSFRIDESIFLNNGGQYGSKGYFYITGIKFTSSTEQVQPPLPGTPSKIMDSFTIVGMGDATVDGVVDAEDLNQLENNFGKTNATWRDGDFNNDGTVDVNDYLAVKRNFGKNYPGDYSAFHPTSTSPETGGLTDILAGTNLSQNSQSIPEPTSMAIISALALAGIGMRRKAR